MDCEEDYCTALIINEQTYRQQLKIIILMKSNFPYRLTEDRIAIYTALAYSLQRTVKQNVRKQILTRQNEIYVELLDCRIIANIAFA